MFLTLASKINSTLTPSHSYKPTQRICQNKICICNREDRQNVEDIDHKAIVKFLVNFPKVKDDQEQQQNIPNYKHHWRASPSFLCYFCLIADNCLSRQIFESKDPSDNRIKAILAYLKDLDHFIQVFFVEFKSEYCQQESDLG